MSEVIPKERLTAFQRWEMASFDDDHDSSVGPGAVREADLLAARETARAQGHAEGLSAGLAEGRAHAMLQQQALEALLGGLTVEFSNASHALADDVLALALDLCKAMLRDSLSAQPARVLPVVREAIGCLPRITQPATLTLHPDDAVLVREALSSELTEAGWRIRTDTALTRGGCRVETADSRIDATVEHRWEKLTRALGQAGSWHD
ncbi:MAG: flagellar assembly protein FliH [Thiobacillus sp.]